MVHHRSDEASSSQSADFWDVSRAMPTQREINREDGAPTWMRRREMEPIVGELYKLFESLCLLANPLSVLNLIIIRDFDGSNASSTVGVLYVYIGRRNGRMLFDSAHSFDQSRYYPLKEQGL
jgi:hypothetical protein